MVRDPLMEKTTVWRVEKARFRRPVIPGDRLDIVSSLAADRSMMVKFECEASWMETGVFDLAYNS